MLLKPVAVVVLLYDEVIEAMIAAVEHSRAEWFHNSAQVFFFVMAVFVFRRACSDDFVSRCFRACSVPGVWWPGIILARIASVIYIAIVHRK